MKLNLENVSESFLTTNLSEGALSQEAAAKIIAATQNYGTDSVYKNAESEIVGGATRTAESQKELTEGFLLVAQSINAEQGKEIFTLTDSEKSALLTMDDQFGRKKDRALNIASGVGRSMLPTLLPDAGLSGPDTYYLQQNIGALYVPPLYEKLTQKEQSVTAGPEIVATFNAVKFSLALFGDPEDFSVPLINAMADAPKSFAAEVKEFVGYAKIKDLRTIQDASLIFMQEAGKVNEKVAQSFEFSANGEKVAMPQPVQDVEAAKALTPLLVKAAQFVEANATEQDLQGNALKPLSLAILTVATLAPTVYNETAQRLRTLEQKGPGPEVNRR